MQQLWTGAVVWLAEHFWLMAALFALGPVVLALLFGLRSSWRGRRYVLGCLLYYVAWALLVQPNLLLLVQPDALVLLQLLLVLGAGLVWSLVCWLLGRGLRALCRRGRSSGGEAP